MEQSSRISQLQIKGPRYSQFTIYLGKSFDNLCEWFVPSGHSPPQILETRTSRVKKLKDRSLLATPESQYCDYHYH